jgi:hypothetical protein
MKSSRLLPWCRSWSRRVPILHGILIAQIILMPFPPSSQAIWVPIDADGDGTYESGYDDGTPEPYVPPPIEPSPNQDSDGDHLSDAEESAAGSNPYNPDSDYDGITDADEVNLTGTSPTNSDSNGNGISDYNEFYGNYTVDTSTSGAGQSPYDYDGDGLADPVDPNPYSTQNDPDSDGDYVPDSQDTHPYTPSIWNDHNGNGINDDAETPNTDIDGDGVANDGDSHPSDPWLSNDWNNNGTNDQNEDWDGDGVTNLQDSHPNSNTLWCDWNGNGVNDDVEAGTADHDGDGYADNADSHAFNSSLWEDWNNNGCNDSQEGNNADADPAPDYLDSDPNDANLWEDWNRNGTNDSLEAPPTVDQDNDGHEDGSDSDPQNNALWSDWNRNGVNDDQEIIIPPADADSDGYSDSSDSDPNNYNLWEDWNRNGYNDSTETQYLDDDSDTHPNAFDSHPQDSNLWNDHNGNGINDQDEIIITDTDGDGYNDTLDTHPSNNTLWNDHNNNGANDETELPPDTDSDSIPDDEDEFPYDFDNDAVTDAEELLLGSNPGLRDSDGDGLSDGEEVYAGTNLLHIDTDGDGLTDFEELRAYDSDPLTPTQIQNIDQESGTEENEGGIIGGENTPTSETPTPLISPEIAVRVSGGETGSNQMIQDGGTIAFPSLSMKQYKEDLSKTLTIYNLGTAVLSGLMITRDGTNKTEFTHGALTTTTLAPGQSTTLLVAFSAPAAAATISRKAVLHIASNDTDEPVFDINLKSVSGAWYKNKDHFFANLSDGNNDGIPDRVAEMYLPLVVTPDGDLDSDGISNFDEYLQGTSLRGSLESDLDDDGLSNIMEDNWSKAYPGWLNKFKFSDAFDDPDKDGLLTLEELMCFWGPEKELKAVASHPFVAAMGPNANTTAPNFNLLVRPAPVAYTPANRWGTRDSTYKAWINDGLLRTALREKVMVGTMTAAAFFTRKYVYAPPPDSTGAKMGSDHIPAGYLVWLRDHGILPALPIGGTDPTNGLFAPPTATQSASLSNFMTQYVPVGADDETTDLDRDNLPDWWETAHGLSWRNNVDTSPEIAQSIFDLWASKLPETFGLRAAWSQVDLMQFVADGVIKEYPMTGPPFPTIAANATAAQLEAFYVKAAKHAEWTAICSIDPDRDGLSNTREFALNKNPKMPDYEPTANRDTDDDGFTDAEETLAGTDVLSNKSLPPYQLIYVSGKTQTTPAGDVLPAPLYVQAIYKNQPRVGMPISFTSTKTGIEFADALTEEISEWKSGTLLAKTNAQGFAAIHVKTPPSPGPISIIAKSMLYIPKSVTFTATSLNPTSGGVVPYELFIIQGDAQKGIAGTRLADALSVQVLKGGNAISGMTVTFTCAPGGVFLSKTGSRHPGTISIDTNILGSATVRFITPPTPGRPDVRASITTGRNVLFQLSTKLASPGTGSGSGPGSGNSQENPDFELYWQAPFRGVHVGGAVGSKRSYYSARMYESTTPPAGDESWKYSEQPAKPQKSHIGHWNDYPVFRTYKPEWTDIINSMNPGETSWGQSLTASAPPDASGMISMASFPDFETVETLASEIRLASSSVIKGEPVVNPEDEEDSISGVGMVEFRAKLRLVAKLPAVASPNTPIKNLPLASLPQGLRRTYLVVAKTYNKTSNGVGELISTEGLTTIELEIPSGESHSLPITINDIDNIPFPVAPNTLVNIDLLPMEVNCPELYMFSGNAGDKVELCMVSGIACEWRLKSASPAIGTFDNPTDLACSFTATTPGKNTIQLVIGGNVAWEKPTEILNIISRATWGAYAANASGMTTVPTINGLTYHHSADTDDGAAEVLDIQEYHMSKGIYSFTGNGWDDIGYNFVMDKAGNIYQGRELEMSPGMVGGPYTLGAHVKGMAESVAAGIGICILGKYETTSLGLSGPEVFPAARQLALEKALSAISRRYKLNATQLSYHKARAVSNPTECPGSNVIGKATDIKNHVHINLQ